MTAHVDNDETRTEQRAGLGAWWMLSILFLLYVYSMLDRIVISILVPQIKEHLLLTDTQMSLILGPAFAVSYAVFGLPLGWAADRWSRRGVIFLGTCVFGFATGASGLAGGFVGLFAARMFVGVGESSLSPAAYSLLADRFPKRQLALAMSIYTMGVKIGSAAALLISGLLVATLPANGVTLPILGDLRPWQAVMLACAAPALPLALMAFTFREPARKTLVKSLPEGHGDLRAFLSSHWRLIAPLMAGFALMGLVSYSLSAWVPTYMARAFEWRPDQYGSALGALNFFTAFALIGTGSMMDWLYASGRKDAYLRFYIWLLAGSLPVMAMLFFVPNPWAFLALYGVIMIVAMPIMAYISSILQLISPTNLRSQMTALFLFIMTVVGGSLGPMAVATLTDHLFHDEARLGHSLAIVILTVSPLALVLLLSALKPFAAMVGATTREPPSA
jgi:MFS family permease